mmetsp:Transcript_17443/g.70091  ORF Transcript_17443/g.70091 Transcript_17443/m.70091 type:complete len:333 (-) Transcript_17443:523-1521(-)
MSGASAGLPATTTSTEKARSASVTDMVPIADERRPEKGRTSGPRWHWVLMLARPTMVARRSTRVAAAAASRRVKSATCWPDHEVLAAVTTSSKSSNAATGTTGPNCSSWKSRIAGVTGATTAGAKSAPARAPPDGLRTVAPFSRASSRSSTSQAGFEASGSGVIETASHGRPRGRRSTATASLSTNASKMLACATTSLIAVHRWPLYDSAPATSSRTVASRSASARTTPMFLPSSWLKTLSRCGCGCALTNASAPFEPPMKPSASTLPVPMMPGSVARPEPVTKLMTPFGKCFKSASTVRMWASAPIAGNLSTTQLPMSNAGTHMAYNSLSG